MCYNDICSLEDIYHLSTWIGRFQLWRANLLNFVAKVVYMQFSLLDIIVLS